MASQATAQAGKLARAGLPLVFVLVLASAAGPASAEWNPGGYMSKALARVMAAGRYLAEKTSYGWDGGICLMGSFVKPKDTIGFTRTLEAGESYVFVGGGDDDVKDLDILVLDSQGHRVARDSKADATPVVEFKPEKTGQYTLRLSLYQAGSASFCALGIFRKDGYNVPMENLSTAAAKLITACGSIAEKAKGARFHQESNQWALFGSVMKEGESQTISGLAPEEANHAIVAMGDDNAKNLDLFFMTDGGDTLKEDTDDDANPLILYATKKEARYRLRIRNTASDGATLVMAAILDIGVNR